MLKLVLLLVRYSDLLHSRALGLNLLYLEVRNSRIGSTAQIEENFSDYFGVRIAMREGSRKMDGSAPHALKEG